MLCPVDFHTFLHFIEQFLAIFRLLHIDKINDDNPSHIPQLQLPSHFFGCCQIDFKGIRFLIVPQFGPVTAIHIDHMESLRMFDNQIGSVFKGNRLSQRRFDLLIHTKMV